VKKALILVEGQTEETLVRDVIGPHLEGVGIAIVPVILKTKRVKAGGAFRGGVTNTAQVLGDIRRLLGDSSASVVTTMLDYYGLPSDFPGMDSRPAVDAYRRVTHVEGALAAAIDDKRFLPNLTLHELEAWVFVAPATCAWMFESSSVPQALEKIRDDCGGPERINEDPLTAPSKRIAKVYGRYQKTLHGPMAIREIGLAAIRSACPHADGWLRSLEAV
jgi:uncharacterized protein DUF4276